MTRLVLGSASVTRRRLLDQAGVTVESHPAAIDEGAVKRRYHEAGGTPQALAEALAEQKAQQVALRYPEAMVIGADQVLACDGRWFDKPDSRATAREQLSALRGRTHTLISSGVVIYQGRVNWRVTETARLTMRSFSDAFVEEYLDRVGDAAYASVGGYQLEGYGVQLFSAVDGDHFVILGLPLLPLLGYLREQRILRT